MIDIFSVFKDKQQKLILASASPRRSELLKQVGAEFSVYISETDEKAVSQDVPVHIYVQELALCKAMAVAKKFREEKNTLIISADTVVYADNKILGKPSDEKDAFEMLKKLSGKVHYVYTGFCILRPTDLKAVCDREVTCVKFFDVSDKQIKDYIKTGEPMDKAGGYGIQGMGALFVEKINGDYNNVVGLPVAKLFKVIEKEFR